MIEHVFDHASPPVRTASPGSPGAAAASGSGPPGWPPRVRPPGATGWQGDVAGWLLDQCPPEYRGHPVLRRHPAVLAWLAELHVRAELAAMREAYRHARVEMDELLPVGSLEALLVCLEREGMRLRGVERSVGLVREALDGQVFVPRL